VRRRGGFTLIELMIAVAIIGILAAVAIPSFMRYWKRAATVEASMNIRRMYDGAVSYYVSEHANSNGVIFERQFPGNVGPTPSSIPPAVKVRPAPGTWDHPSWYALDFAVMDPIRYSYSFSSSGVGTNAFAHMVAQGDLDGDGVSSLFRRSCSGTNEGVRGGSGLETVNELE
jgi:prepilin-type N-terminal cleavage/methylation domain-containing protein